MLVHVCNTCGCRMETLDENKWAHKKRYYTSEDPFVKIITELDLEGQDTCMYCYNQKIIEKVKEYLEILSRKES